jgi:hypothetical protein
LRQRCVERPAWQRVIALAAAYAVALSSLVASYSLAHAAATTSAVPSGVICHSIVDADQAPVPVSETADHCIDNCCIGCIMLLAALPPPPAKPVGVLQSSRQRLAPPAHDVLAARPKTTSHHSRAPPSKA